jgi:hypothetical protein
MDIINVDKIIQSITNSDEWPFLCGVDCQLLGCMSCVGSKNSLTGRTLAGFALVISSKLADGKIATVTYLSFTEGYSKDCTLRKVM